MTTHLGLQRILLPTAQVSSLTTGSITLPSARGTFVPPTSYESIASSSQSSGTSITFNSISGNYASLQLRINTLVGSGGVIYMQLNGDSNTNYTRHVLSSSGSSVGTAGNTARNYCQLTGFYRNPSQTYPFVCLVDIHNYASTTQYKTVRTVSGIEQNGTGEITFFSNLWLNTNAITSITIATDGTFSAGNSIALYGIKGA